MALPSRIMRIRLQPSYPIRDDAGTAIAISKSGGVQTTSVDFAKQDLTAGIADPSTATVLVLRSTGEYERATLDQLVFPPAGSRTPRGDADYTVLTTDRFVGLTATLTAGRAWTLPAASAVPGGTAIVFADEAGGLSSANPITITRAGSDTINGATTFVLGTARMGVTLVSDGISKWTVALVGTASLVDGVLSADTAGRAKMADGFLTTTKAADGFLSADTTGRAKMADAFLVNAKVADATLTFAKAAANEFRAAPKLTRTITSASSAGDRTLTAADIGKLVVFSGTTDFTVTFSAAATLANGWSVAFAHEGKCVVTLDPNGSETIDGVTTATILYKQTGEIFCDGSALRSIGKQSRVLLETQTFSGVTNVAFTSIAPGYRRISFIANEISLANAAANVNANFSVDNGSSWRVSSGDYIQHYLPMSSGTQTPTLYTTASSLQFLVGNVVATRLHDFEITIYRPSFATTRHRGKYSASGDVDNGGNYFTNTGHFVFIGPSVAAKSAIRFLASSGNFAGTIALYGDE